MTHDAYDPNRENAHWDWLRLQLPSEGVTRLFPDDAACLARVKAVRWPNGVACGRCGQDEPRTLKTRSVFECRACKRQFSCKAGTVFHRSRIPLTIWF
ncbi:transposase [Roseovarius sp. Pro17]|uniref:transposase n=1 Tax=Roseovarius sp. Pro17 TaxID=3108175 RepID=UPI003A7F5D9E